jgi:hypothetical protein
MKIQIFSNVMADSGGRAFKAWVCDRSLAGIAVSNPAGVMEFYFL